MHAHDEPWRHALIGCGRIAAHHADAIRHAPPLRLACVVDADPAAAAACGAAHGVPARTLADVLADPGIHCVSLATPHDLHLAQARQAVAAGKHVLIEKPPGLDPGAVADLAGMAAAARVVAMPVAQHRFDALAGAVKGLLDSGDLGPVRLARCDLECVRAPSYYADSDWRGRWAREGGSVLMNQAYHFVDMLIWLLGPVRDARALYATLTPGAPMETEDTLAATLRFDAGALATLAITGAGGGEWHNRIELVGARGAVAFDLSKPARLHRLELRSKRALKQWRAAFEVLTPALAAALPSGGATGYYGVSHRAQFQAFVAAMGGAPAPCAATLAQAAQAVATIRALYGRDPGGDAHAHDAG